MTAPLRTRVGSFALAITGILMFGFAITLLVWAGLQPSSIETNCVTDTSGTACNVVPNSAIQLAAFGALIAGAAGLAVVVTTWNLDRRPSERPRQGWTALRRRGDPLIWLVLLPLLSWPLTFAIGDFVENPDNCTFVYDFIVGTASCRRGALLPVVLIPGLLNLAPLLWFLCKDRRRVPAATVASVLGITGLAGGLFGLQQRGPTVVIFKGLLPEPFPYDSMPYAAFGLILWLCALIGLLVLAKLPTGPSTTPDAGRLE